jgi:D-3-phosphoglycerate dehydrogenase
MMKVLIADKFEKVGIDGLRELQCNVSYQPDVTAADLPGLVREFDPKILIVRSKKVNAAALEAGPGLGLVIRAGAGIDTIDVAAASRLGVFVSNCPGKNSIAVAELVLGLVLSLDRRIADQVADIRKGVWNKADYSKSRGLHGRTLGIVGLGQIGREIAVRAQSFGMRVVAWSRQLTIEDATALAIGYCQTPIEVAQQSDILSLNVAGTAETKHLVNKEFLDAMRPGAFLINTARGTVVDEGALAEAVRSKGIRAGLDVYDNEPGSGKGDFHPAIVDLPGLHRAGPGGDRPRSDPDRPGIPEDRWRAQLRQPARQEFGHPCAERPAREPSRCAGPRVHRPRQRGHQRRRGGEHHLPWGPGYPGQDPPVWRARPGVARPDPDGQLPRPECRSPAHRLRRSS